MSEFSHAIGELENEIRHIEVTHYEFMITMSDEKILSFIQGERRKLANLKRAIEVLEKSGK